MERLPDLYGKVCVVFGAANQGIGYAVASHALMVLRMRVIICDLEESKCAKAADSLASSQQMIRYCVADVSDPTQVRKVFDTLELSWARDLALVCNAAAVFADSDDGNCLSATFQDWELAYRVNVVGAANIQNYAIQAFPTTHRCHLVQIGSLSALTGGSGEPYVSSKTALLCMTESLYRTVKINGDKYAHIATHIVLPGVVRTQFARSSIRAKRLLSTESTPNPINALSSSQAQELKEMMTMALTPEDVSSSLFEGIRQDRFYIIVDNNPPMNLKQVLADRFTAVTETTKPSDLVIPPILVEARQRHKSKV